jgi:hypothetical protein
LTRGGKKMMRINFHGHLDSDEITYLSEIAKTVKLGLTEDQKLLVKLSSLLTRYDSALRKSILQFKLIEYPEE